MPIRPQHSSFLRIQSPHYPRINDGAVAHEHVSQLFLALAAVAHGIGDDNKKIEVAVRLVISTSPRAEK